MGSIKDKLNKIKGDTLHDDNLQNEYSKLFEEPKPTVDYTQNLGLNKPLPKNDPTPFNFPASQEYMNEIPAKEESNDYAQKAQQMSQRVSSFSPKMEAAKVDLKPRTVKDVYEGAQEKIIDDENKAIESKATDDFVNNSISTIDKQINEMESYDGLLGEIELKSGRVSPLLGTMDEDKQKAYNRLHQAKRLLNKFKNYKNDSEGFWDGLKQSDWMDTLTVGFQSLIETGNLKHVADKSAKGLPLTEDEQAILTSYALLEQLKQGNESSLGYDVAQTVVGMIPFMAQLALTGGTGSIVKGGGELLKQGIKQGIKSYLKKMPSGFLRYALESVPKTLAMPMFQKDAIRRTTDDIVLNEQGQGEAIPDTGKGVLEATARAFAVTFGERATEAFGGIIDDIGSVALKGTMGKIGKSVLFDNKAINFANELRRLTGINSAPGEWMEENLMGIYQPMVDDEAKFSDTFNSRTQATILLSSIIPASMMKIAESGGNYATISRPYKQAEQTLLGIFGEDAQQIIQANSSDNLSERMAANGQLSMLADTPEKRAAVLDYFTRKVDYDTLKESLSEGAREEVSTMVNKETGQIHPVKVEDKEMFITNTQDGVASVFNPETGKVELVSSDKISDEMSEVVDPEVLVQNNVGKLLQSQDLVGETLNIQGKEYSVDAVDGEIVSLFPADGNGEAIELPMNDVMALQNQTQMPLVSQPAPGNLMNQVPDAGNMVQEQQQLNPQVPVNTPQTWQIGNKNFSLQTQEDGSFVIPFEDGKDNTKIIEKEIDDANFEIVPITEEVSIQNAPAFAKKKTQTVVKGVKVVPKITEQVIQDEQTVPENISPAAPLIEDVAETQPEVGTIRNLINEQKATQTESEPSLSVPTPIEQKPDRSKSPIGVSKDILPLLQSVPENFEQGLLQYILSGGRIDRDQFIKYSGLKGKDLVPFFGILKKGGQQLDTLNEVVETYGKNSESMDLINEAVNIITSNPGKRVMGERLQQLFASPFPVDLTEFNELETSEQQAIDDFSQTEELPESYDEVDEMGDDFWMEMVRAEKIPTEEEVAQIFGITKQNNLPLQDESTRTNNTEGQIQGDVAQTQSSEDVGQTQEEPEVKEETKPSEPEKQSKPQFAGSFLTEKKETTFDPKPDDVNYQLAYNAYRGISFDPKKRAKQTQDGYMESMNSFKEELYKYAKSEDQKKIAEEQLIKYKEGYLKKNNAWLSAKSRTLSSMITGPARFNTSRNEKANNAEHKRLEEFLEWDKKFQANAIKTVKGGATQEEKDNEAWVSIKTTIDDKLETIVEIDKGLNKYTSRQLIVSNLSGFIKRMYNNGQYDHVTKAMDHIQDVQSKLEKPILTKNNSLWQLKANSEIKITEKANTPSENVGTELYYEEGKHSKTGAVLHIAKIKNKVSKEEYGALSEKAKENGGYYSSYVKGFIFKTKEGADSFIGENANNEIESEEEGAMFSLTSPFYTNSQAALTSIQQPKGTPEQFKAMLLKNGAKQDELDWMGWDEFAKDKKSLTKEEIQNWIDENKVEVKEVVKGKENGFAIASKIADSLAERYSVEYNTDIYKVPTGYVTIIDDNGSELDFSDINEIGIKELADDEFEFINESDRSIMIDLAKAYSESKTKYSEYTIPGGKNYKEVLLTLPQKKDEDNFKSSHFSEPNIAAHIRINEFTTKDGKRALNLEEVQSDWGQEGKKKGYAEKYKPEEVIELDSNAPEATQPDFFYYFKVPGNVLQIPKSKYKTVEEARDYVFNDKRTITNGVPPMPFKKTDQWTGLGMKWALRYAAENGFDVVTWTTGETQAERYDLSKQVDSISYSLKDGKIWIYPKLDPTPIVKKFNSENELTDIVGKEVASKIYNNEGLETGTGDVKELREDGLKVGGEGMKGFYDQILPAWTNKYVKKWGAKVGETEIESDGKPLNVHSIELTPEMKESVLGGQPMFKIDNEQSSNSKPFLQSYYDELNSGAPIKVVSNIDEIIENYKESGGSSKYIISRLESLTGLDGVFLEGVDKIYVSDKIIDKDIVWIHENTHFGAMLTIPNKSVRDNLFKKIYNSIGENKIRFSMPFYYMSLTDEVRAEEYLAYKTKSLFNENKINIDDAYETDEISDLINQETVSEEQIQKLINTFVRNSFNYEYDTDGNNNSRSRNGRESTGTRESFGRRLRPLYGLSETGNGSGGSVPESNPKRFAGEQIKRPQSETAAFKNWFGQSKITDENGKPQVYYHATGGNFDTFQPNDKGLIFASPDAQWAQAGFMPLDKEQGTSGSVMPVYVKAENPFDYRNPEHLSNLLENLDVRESIQEHIRNGRPMGIEKPVVIEKIKELGYDSLYVTEESVTNIGVFEPTQVKSSLGNKGTFDKENPNVLFSVNQTKSESFKKWFEGSKVVDENGKPLVVYHGTKKQFNEFKEGMIGVRSDTSKGFYFSPIEQVGKNFSGKDGVVMPVFLSIKNPKVLSSYIDIGTLNKDRIDKLISEGFDGAYFKPTKKDIDSGYYKPYNEEWVALSPTQIKSATGNNGGFDPNNPDIRFSLPDSEPPAVIPPSNPTDNFAGSFLRPKGKFKPLTRFEKIQENLQDRMLRVKKLLEGLKVTNTSNIYKVENLASSRANAAINDFNDNLFTPIIETFSELQKTGKSSEQTQQYMKAKHAIERNKWMREQSGVNKVFAGMEDKEANDIVKEYEKDLSWPTLKKLWKQINQATDYTLNKYVEYGFMTKQTLADIKARDWKFYVPLRGWELSEEEKALDEQYNRPVGAGALNPIKKAKGRETESDDPLPYIASMAHSIVAMGEKNRVKQAAVKLVMNNKDRDDLFYMKKVYQVFTDPNDPTKYTEVFERPENPYKVTDENGTELKSFNSIKEAKSFLETDEQAKEIEIPFKEFDNKMHEYKKERAKWKQHEVEAFINGDKYVAVFNDPTVAQAINYDNQWKPEFTKEFQQSIGRVTRMLSANFTAKNPAFIPVNGLRDVAYATIAMGVKHGTNPVEFLKNINEAKGTILRDFSKKSGKDPRQKQLDAYYKEFKEWGGETGYIHLFEIDDLKRQIDRQLRILNNTGTKAQKAYDFVNQAKYIQAAGKMLERMAILSENMSRFATFANMRDKGKTPIDAAYAAKEVTVNFNRKGRMTGALGSVYAFFNASVQGGANALNMASEHKGKFVAVSSGFFAMGVLNALLASLWDDDDKYKNVNDYIKQTNIVIPKGIGSDSYISIPLPQFFRQFFAAGVLSVQAFGKEKEPEQAMGEVISNAFESLSPVNPVSFVNKKGKTGAWDLTRPFWPTITTPALDLIMNEDFAGKRIVNTPYTKELEEIMASSQKYTKGTNPILVKTFDELYKLGGGDMATKEKYSYDFEDKEFNKVPLLMDINPSSVEHIIEYYTGGRGKFFSDMIKLSSEIVKGAQGAIEGKEFKEAFGEFNANSIPVLNRFNRTLYSNPANDRLRLFYDQGDELETFKRQKEKYKDGGDYDKFSKMAQDENYGQKLSIYESFKGSVDEFNKLIKSAPDEEIKKQFKEQRDEIVKQYFKTQTP